MRGTAPDAGSPAPPGGRLRAALADPENAKAVGLAGATLAANGLAVVFTVVFARILGADDYGSLAALLSTFLILSVPGAALQVAAARETALDRLGHGGTLSRTVERWMERLALTMLVVCVAGAALRDPIAGLIGVDQSWAAAATGPTGVAWLALSIERGILQGLGSYKAVGLSVVLEAGGRLVLGLILVGGGLDVTGAYLGTPLSMLVTALVLAAVLRRRLGHPERVAEHHRLRDLIAGAWAPVLGLTLFAVLQNIDVIVVKQRIGGDPAGAYAAAAVAAKLIIWVAIGVALYLLPEAARRAGAGLSARTVLARGLAVIGLVAAPAMAIYLLAPRLLLELAFGPDFVQASGSLAILGAAMTALAVTYLSVQYMLALHRTAFIALLAVFAAVEPVALSFSGRELVDFALIVLAVQLAACAAMLVIAVRASHAPAALAAPAARG